MVNWHSLEKEEVISKLHSSEDGLRDAEVQNRLKLYGRNELVKVRKLDGLKIFLRQFFSFLVLILIVAAIVSALLNHWIDFYVIFGIVIINSVFGFVQEYKAEKAIEKLKNMLVPEAKVLREGRVVEIDARDIVKGDVLILGEGDKIMADARVLSESGLKIREAALTGESVPSEKSVDVLPIDTPLAERLNMIFKGTDIVSGKCKAIVVRTGMNTEYGKIASMVQDVKGSKNPLKEKLDNFAKKLALITLALLLFIVVVGLSVGFSISEMFFTSVSLAVSVIPEGLPAIITLGLALATKKMLKHNVLIRKLPASETLGRTTVICSDKTGTMTEEKMQVKGVYVNKKSFNKIEKFKEALMLFKIGILCNSARIEENGDEEYLIGDPTEQALILSAKSAGLSKKKLTEENPRLQEFAFSSTRKMMSVIRQKGNDQTSYVKGAPEEIVKRCSSELVQGKVVRISDIRKKEILREYEKFAKKGMRVLGFACKPIIGKITIEKAESGLIFVGLQAMIDPPRKEVKEAILDSQNAGVRVVMITGDSLLTAREVGRQIGLKSVAITGEDLKKLSKDDFIKKIKEVNIIARANPEDKLRIVEALKEEGEIVAVTGDGVNDAPALKKADIGIAVERGTDVAKDSSDMVLLDNNFASIAKAIKEGRRVYDNIKKFIKFLLSANFAQVFLVLSVLLIWQDPKFLPLLPLQILWINLVTDSFPALALSQEEVEGDVMKMKPKKNGILGGIKGFVLLGGFLAFVISFIAFFFYIEDIDKARTMAVTSSVIFEMFLVFNCKSTKSVFKSPKNNYLIGAVAVSIVLHLLVLYTPMNILFSFVPLLFADWVLIFVFAIVGFFIIEGFKFIGNKKRVRKK